MRGAGAMAGVVWLGLMLACGGGGSSDAVRPPAFVPPTVEAPVIAAPPGGTTAPADVKPTGGGGESADAKESRCSDAWSKCRDDCPDNSDCFMNCPHCGGCYEGEDCDTCPAREEACMTECGERVDSCLHDCDRGLDTCRY
jgi:hypothetical protein